MAKIFLNDDKHERAVKAVAGKAKEGSAEWSLASKANPKLSDAEKVLFVYRGLGGVLKDDSSTVLGIPKKRGDKVTNEDEVTDLGTKKSRKHKQSEVKDEEEEDE